MFWFFLELFLRKNNCGAFWLLKKQDQITIHIQFLLTRHAPRCVNLSVLKFLKVCKTSKSYSISHSHVVPSLVSRASIIFIESLLHFRHCKRFIFFFSGIIAQLWKNLKKESNLCSIFWLCFRSFCHLPSQTDPPPQGSFFPWSQFSRSSTALVELQP